jgi:DNA-directed RNA polymerase subunit beta
LEFQNSKQIGIQDEILYFMLIEGRAPKPEDDFPETFRVLIRELRSLALELNYFLVSEKNFQIHRKGV